MNLDEFIKENELVIAMKNAHDVPQVWLNGKAITMKVHVRFEWETMGADDFGKTMYDIDHHDTEEKVRKLIKKTRISDPREKKED